MRPESSRPSQANLRNIGRNRPETRSSRTTSPSASTIASVSSSSRLSRKAIRASRAPGGQALQTGETSSSIRVLRIGLSFSFRRSVTANATAVAASRQTTTTVGASLVKVSDPSQRSIRVASFGVRNQPPASARHSRVKRFLVLLLGCAAVFGAAPGQAQAQECGLPSRQPLWIDFADGSVPYWTLFARPGVVAAAANFIYPPQIRALGADRQPRRQALLPRGRLVGVRAPLDCSERAVWVEPARSMVADERAVPLERARLRPPALDARRQALPADLQPSLHRRRGRGLVAPGRALRQHRPGGLLQRTADPPSGPRSRQPKPAQGVPARTDGLDGDRHTSEQARHHARLPNEARARRTREAEARERMVQPREAPGARDQAGQPRNPVRHDLVLGLGRMGC